ncbi:poly-gamma-glutamate hydrolase family protein, partial [Priestia megaterium]
TVYVFKTLKTENPFELHVTSANYDEEMARHLVKKSAVTISLHGAYSDVCTTYIGGRDEELEKAVRHALSGFPISETPVHLKGVSPRNIANGNQRHKGLQLEITTPQYEQLLKDNQLFNEYVNAVVSAVNSVM